MQRYVWVLILSFGVFLFVVILGCNLTMLRLSEVVGQDLGSFFSAKVIDQGVLLNFCQQEYHLDRSKGEEIKQAVNIYIQNSQSNVKLTLVAGYQFLNDAWQNCLDFIKLELSNLQKGD